ncbi:hypothetical protein FHG87_021265 [Trinorchestia longiramus]|nr:hypothetical protein FHG87_021265 [Trinorchestia longiramus]
MWKLVGTLDVLDDDWSAMCPTSQAGEIHVFYVWTPLSHFPHMSPMSPVFKSPCNPPSTQHPSPTSQQPPFLPSNSHFSPVFPTSPRGSGAAKRSCVQQRPSDVMVNRTEKLQDLRSKNAVRAAYNYPFFQWYSSVGISSGTPALVSPVVLYCCTYRAELILGHREPSYRLFPVKIPATWNQLPENIVSAGTVNTFKNRLDKYWIKNPPVLYYTDSMSLALGPVYGCDTLHPRIQIPPYPSTPVSKYPRIQVPPYPSTPVSKYPRYERNTPDKGDGGVGSTDCPLH